MTARAAVTRRRAAARPTLVLSCEHATPRVPRRYAALFAGAEALLASHRGWDPGALRVARRLARTLDAPLLAARWSRLLVDANRSPSNPAIWSRFTRALPRAERERILERCWRPHRDAVALRIARATERGGRVVHVAVHSFTPVLDGRVRHVDVGLLYDPRRSREAALARRWRAALRERAPSLCIRFNDPYRGSTDGLATWLRRRHAAARYAGLELELSQALLADRSWAQVARALAASLADALAAPRSRARRNPRPGARRAPHPRAL